MKSPLLLALALLWSAAALAANPEPMLKTLRPQHLRLLAAPKVRKLTITFPAKALQTRLAVRFTPEGETLDATPPMARGLWPK